VPDQVLKIFGQLCEFESGKSVKIRGLII
jgi:hypothetical protein